MYATTYIRPTSLAQAVELLKASPEAKPLSGGMTLIPTLKQRLAAPSHLLDLSHLPELQGIRLDGKLLRIGAATPHAVVANSPIVAEALPALAYLAGLIADPQVRNRGTIGGSVANNDPAADYPSAVLALGATVVTSARRIPAEEFFTGMFETALAPDELITEIEFPLPDRAAYAKCRHGASGYAVVGVFIAQTGAGFRVAVTGAQAFVYRWREAEAALQKHCDESALDGLNVDADELLDDVHTSARYRANLIGVYARQAVAALKAAK
ncbi:xanthine dehydrogenase family protein subunit M [Oxalobacteraceae bacterium CAVE-383]|nr:xanthine dehydrogenase family protein subunit M [Oxalobacteraceae bacterium CAVE-383]